MNTHRCRLSMTRDRFLAVAVKMYNALPRQLTELKNALFKRQMKELILKNPYYATTEYFEGAGSLGLSTTMAQLLTEEFPCL